MKKSIRTHTFFNLGTQRALYEKVDGYINKEFYIKEYIEKLKKVYKLDKIYRFDLGQNNEGSYKGIENLLKEIMNGDNIAGYIKNYPEFVCRDLRKKIANLHNISPDWIQLSAGLEQMISMISATFLELNDRIMTTAPSFFLFEEFSKRMGAIPIYLTLKEEYDFNWTIDSFNEYVEILDKLQPKLIWIANPNNPTGGVIRKDMLTNIVKIAAEHYTFVVIDEAYGEYIDPHNDVTSTSSLLKEYNNLIVLRTFSKAYGLANLRVGYAMSSDTDIIRALKVHSTNFPIPQFSYDIAESALENISFLEEVRNNTRIRKAKVVKELRLLPNISFIESYTNTMIIKHNDLSADELITKLEKFGIITSKVPSDTPPLNQYIRITINQENENKFLLEKLKEI